MNKEISKLVLPNKKINYFTVSILILGFLCGCIFLILLSNDDKTSTINQVTSYFNGIKDGSFNSGLALKNNLIINYLYIISIWVLGLSLIGLLFNIFIIYIKGFVVGFTISAMMLSFKIKGIVSATLYLLFGLIFNILIILLVGIYSFSFSIQLIKILSSKKKAKNTGVVRKYLIILIGAIIFTLIATLLETFVLPNIIKIIIKLFVE
mgnify:FL=1